MTQETVKIEITWHKAAAKIAATKAQIDYLRMLCFKANVEFPFSTTSAMRSLTGLEASKAIQALKNNETISFQ